MKIGFVLDDSLDRTDGVQQYVLSLGKWLSNRDHEIHYLVGETKRHDLKNIHSLSTNIKVSFNKNQLSIPLPTSKSRIKKLLAENMFDVIHVQMPYSPQLAGRLIKQMPESTVIIGTFHILPFSKLEQLATKFLSLIVRSTLRRFNRFIAVSEPAHSFAKESFGINSVVVPNPVSSTRVTKHKQSGGRTIQLVFLGRLVERKGILYLIEAYNRLVEQDRSHEYHLTVYGAGHLDSTVQELVVRLGLSNHVSLAGFLGEEQKTAALSRADLAIFPSLGGESFGIVLIEAMASGAFVTIGGDNLGYRSVLRDKRTLFDTKNPDSLVDCITSITSNRRLANQLHAQQRELVKRYMIDNVGKEILEIYEQEIAKLSDNANNR